MSVPHRPSFGSVSAPRPRFVATCALALVAAVACERAEPLRFTVLFEQNHDVEAGDAVVYKEMEVGRVTAVGLDANGKVSVEVQIEPRYQGAMATTSLVSVERAGVLGGRRLVVADGEGERLPLPPGSTLIGHEANTPGVFERLRAASQGAMAGLGAVGADLTHPATDCERAAVEHGLAHAFRTVIAPLLEPLKIER